MNRSNKKSSPVAPGAKGQPPRPATELSITETPIWRAMHMFATACKRHAAGVRWGDKSSEVLSCFWGWMWAHEDTGMACKRGHCNVLYNPQRWVPSGFHAHFFKEHMGRYVRGREMENLRICKLRFGEFDDNFSSVYFRMRNTSHCCRTTWP